MMLFAVCCLLLCCTLSTYLSCEYNYCNHRYSTGCEVFNSYGRRPNSNLLIDFGFALNDNEWDCVSGWIGLIRKLCVTFAIVIVVHCYYTPSSVPDLCVIAMYPSCRLMFSIILTALLVQLHWKLHPEMLLSD